MHETWLSRFVSARGRTARSDYWWLLVLATLIFWVLFVFLEATLGAGATYVLYPVYFWCAGALSARRMRDRGRSPGWLLAALVPVLGPLWLFVELGLRRGSPGENRYGPDPLETVADYLTVK